MVGIERMRDIAQHLLQYSKAQQTEVVLLGEDSQLTRFAGSRIHQNVAERNLQARVRAVSGKRVGVAATNDLADESLRRVAEQALQIALLQPENPEFKSLPGPTPIAEVNGFSRATAECPPEKRARAVASTCQLAKEKGLVASGAFSTSTTEIAVANSLGVFAYSPSTVSEFVTVVMSDDSSGYASAAALNVDDIDAENLGREAVGKAIRSRHPRALEPGVYPVILEEHAVATMVSYLAYLGFSALAMQEGRSFMTGKLGQRLVGENISIWDDGHDPTGLPMSFDFEGVPKKRVDLIAAGQANAVVYDSYTANKEGKVSTGHALPAPNTFGPFPANMFMAPGQDTKEQMLADLDRGLLITRFHYVNPVHPLKAILTGMTRDGTFWVEDGQVRWPVRNLRFTQSILEALSCTRRISRETCLHSGFVGGMRVPALMIDQFAFSSATQF